MNTTRHDTTTTTDLLLAALKRLCHIAVWDEDFSPADRAEFDAAFKQAEAAISLAEQPIAAEGRALVGAYFVAVRHSVEGYDWLDVATMSGEAECVRASAAQTDAKIPQWADANRVARIARVLVTETPDGTDRS